MVKGGAGYRVSAIDGFTITNGYAHSGGGLYLGASSPTIANNTITGNRGSYYGGGLSLDHSSATIANNTITGNGTSDYGGGLYLRYSSPTIANNTIEGNDAGRDGGGLYLHGSSPTIANNTITGNIADYGGGLYLDYSSPTIANSTITGNSAKYGGGMYLEKSSPTIANNTITGNGAEDYGGGLYLDGSSYYCSPTIANNVIAGNGADYGGGLCLYGSSYYCSPTIANNTITSNGARYGGGLYLYSSPATIANNTITGNGAPYGGGLCLYYGSPTIVNTIIAFNSSGIYRYPEEPGTPTLRYNCVYGNTAYDYEGLTNPTGTDGNISDDPLFVQEPDPGPDAEWGTEDDEMGDPRLLFGSPCIDAGDNDGVPPDTADLDGDSDTAEPLPLDLAGNPRFLDDPLTADTGSAGAAGPPVVDMGAYEFFADCNDNGIPDECDLDCGALGGMCERYDCGRSPDCDLNSTPDECDADSDGDGVIDDCDQCPDSSDEETIVIGDCDTGVTNLGGYDGCTMTQQLDVCHETARNHGAFVSCVVRTANTWRQEGLISRDDQGRIAECAAHFSEGRQNGGRSVKGVRTTPRGGE